MRQTSRVEWVVIALIAVVVVGLGTYLLVRPAGDTASAAHVSSPTETTAATPTSHADDELEVSTAPMASDQPDSDGSAADIGDGVGLEDGVVDSAAQLPGLPTTDEPETIGPFGDLARRVEGDPFAIGAVDAPIVMVEFADYRCPFCAVFSQTHLPDITQKYVDSGVLRFEWRDMPIFGDESENAAVAGRAAARQGKFWEFNTAVYAAAPGKGHPEMSRDDLIAFARDVGIADLAAFESDLTDRQLLADVRTDMDAGAVLGVPSVPAFVVNGYPMLGAQPIDDFYNLIDGALALHEKASS